LAVAKQGVEKKKSFLVGKNRLLTLENSLRGAEPTRPWSEWQEGHYLKKKRLTINPGTKG